MLDIFKLPDHSAICSLACSPKPVLFIDLIHNYVLIFISKLLICLLNSVGLSRFLWETQTSDKNSPFAIRFWDLLFNKVSMHSMCAPLILYHSSLQINTSCEYHSKCLREVYYINNITLIKQTRNFILKNSINSVKQDLFHKNKLIGICYFPLINSFITRVMPQTCLYFAQNWWWTDKLNYLNHPVFFFQILVLWWFYSSSLGYALPS